MLTVVSGGSFFKGLDNKIIADRLNLLHCTRCGFEQYKSSKLGQMLVSLPRYAPFDDSHQKDSCFQT